jgi:hypothetical protein
MKKLHFLLLLTLSFASCKKILDDELPYAKPSLVINSSIDPSEEIEIQISTGVSVRDTAQIQSVNNAVAEIFENGISVGIARYDGFGFYRLLNFLPKHGNKYSVVVNVENFEPASASSIIPNEVLIQNLTLKDSAYTDQWGNLYSTFSFSIPDAPEENFYMVELYVYYPLREVYSPVYIDASDPGFDGVYGSGFLIFDDKRFNGRNYFFEGSFYSDYFGPGFSDDPDEPMPDPEEKLYVVRFSTLSKDLYLYKSSFFKHLQNQGNPFSEPVPVFTNIKNGLGIFGGRNSKLYIPENR